MRDPNALPAVNPQTEKYNEAIENIRSDLGIFANIRGGRVRGASISLKSRRTRMRDAKIRLPQLMSMVPALVASSVGARWQPQVRPLHDPANGDPSKSSAALWNGKLQLHPDTPSNHPAYAKWGTQVEKRSGTPPSGSPPPASRTGSRTKA
jgi:Ca2+-transporting ATPase